MAQKILISKIIFLILLLIFSNFASAKTISGKAKIIDGDTIHIGNNKIRLHGIDAPEFNQTCSYNNIKWKCGEESKVKLEKIIQNKIVECKTNKIDKYERFIAICYNGEININKIMVRDGWAIAYRYYSLDYINDENFAKKKKLGIWKGKFLEPYKFRKKNKN